MFALTLSISEILTFYIFIRYTYGIGWYWFGRNWRESRRRWHASGRRWHSSWRSWCGFGLKVMWVWVSEIWYGSVRSRCSLEVVALKRHHNIYAMAFCNSTVLRPLSIRLTYGWHNSLETFDINLWKIAVKWCHYRIYAKRKARNMKRSRHSRKNSKVALYVILTGIAVLVMVNQQYAGNNRYDLLFIKQFIVVRCKKTKSRFQNICGL